MEIREITEKNIWEDFLLTCREKTFLSSWNWGEFNKLMEEKIWRFGVYDKENLITVFLVVKVSAKRGTFLLVPHGPNINPRFLEKTEEIIKTILFKLKEVAKTENASFLRISPILERKKENDEAFEKTGFKKAPTHMHPEASWKLNIEPAEDELLANMRKTTRYLIKQALKNPDLEIYQSTKIKDVDVFNELNLEVAKVQKFVPFSIKYLKNEFSAFNSDNQISLFCGKCKGQIISFAFVLFWSEIGFYHHAALKPEFHKIPVSYLLQWEAIREAKKRGCKLYDFWGYVDPQKMPHHPWAGPTLFKVGFNGKVFEYVKTQDYPLSFKYYLTFFFEKLRKTKRGL